uniref:Tryptophan synthase alpha chain n=1 Tax=Polysiphonia sertularioides TaxID=945028 RepID=A0A1Z1M957_9FLOR|nr:Tryptophan synthase alpha subunit [Polysiphonia sertularioides]ARW62432.1 Tryptophan synthase alpha subunit [Polysiphonia sertularioides]
MNYISSVLETNLKRSSCSFIPFITAGYPDINTTIDALSILDREGADIIELGVPYSDALADGIVIQNASKVAISNDVNIDKIIDMLSKIKIQTPIIIFSYYNPILSKGVKKFISEIAVLGVKGLVIPDLPLEESNYILSLCLSCDIELVFFVAPTSSKTRILSIVDKSPGCLYLVSSTGVTGLRDSLDDNISYIANEVLVNTTKMIMLGFGISSPNQIGDIVKNHNSISGVVVGTAIIRILDKCLDDQNFDLSNELGSFCRLMKSATFI